MGKIRIIMIDAFKPEYLQYAPYLSSLTKKFQWGWLEMPPGHNGGLEIFFRGDSSKLATFYRKDKSSLFWIRYFIWLENFGKIGRLVLDCMINLPRFVRGKELHRTGLIPLKELYKFEIEDHITDKDLSVDYIYIGSLDTTGHKYGTRSLEITKEIKKIDKKISKMDFDIILSDHGMSDVKETVEVPITENCFIDSDMARYWGDSKELEKIKKELPFSNGEILDWQDKKYGDLILLANPGVLISPNYWYGSKRIKGMHGYNGKHKDMKGIYIIKEKGNRKDVEVRELHHIFKRMLEENGRE